MSPATLSCLKWICFAFECNLLDINYFSFQNETYVVFNESESCWNYDRKLIYNVSINSKRQNYEQKPWYCFVIYFSYIFCRIQLFLLTCRIKASSLRVKTEWYLLEFAYKRWGNLQVCIFAREVFVFLSVRRSLYLFLLRFVAWIIHLKVNAAKNDLFFTCLKRKEKQKVSFCYIAISH